MARVGDTFITERDFAAAAAEADESLATYISTPFGRKNLIDALVRERLAELDIEDKKLKDSAAFKEKMQLLRQEMETALAAAAKTMLLEQWAEELADNAVTSVTDKEIADYYKKYPYEMTIRQVVLSNADDADIVLRALRANKGRFNEMIKKYSAQDPEAAKSLTFMPGEFIENIEIAAANMGAGAVQGFIKTPHGFHIIIKDAERRLTQKEAEGRIRVVLSEKKLGDYLSALTEKYKVEVYEEHE